jgi:diadenosine tetraphosphate (Ap4A) HIT family hydrolase
MDNPNLNFVCNQGYAQAVHHVHFHLVPAPIFATVTPAPSQEPSTPHSTRPPNPDAPPTTEAICKMERENRDELDDDDARRIVEKIRSKL